MGNRISSSSSQQVGINIDDNFISSYVNTVVDGLNNDSVVGTVGNNASQSKARVTVAAAAGDKRRRREEEEQEDQEEQQNEKEGNTNKRQRMLEHESKFETKLQ